MFELPAIYKVKYNEEDFEILYPVNDKDIEKTVTHDFDYLKKHDCHFFINYKNIHLKVMEALLNNKKVKVSKFINYHYLQEDDIEIFESEQQNNTDMGYYIYTTQNFSNETFIFYITNKKIISCSNLTCIEISEELYNILNQCYNKYPYAYLKIINYQIDMKLTIEDIRLIHYYVDFTTQTLNQQINNILDNDIILNIKHGTTSEPVYSVLNVLNQKQILDMTKIQHIKEHLDIITFIKNYFYKVITKENMFYELPIYKKLLDVENITGNEREAILVLFKNDPIIHDIKTSKYLKTKYSKYQLYIQNLHVTQFLSFHYISCIIYNLEFMTNNYIHNVLCLNQNSNFSKISVDDILFFENEDNLLFFENVDELFLYQNIDKNFLNIVNDNDIVSVSLKNKREILSSLNQKTMNNVLILSEYKTNKLFKLIRTLKKNENIDDYEYVYLKDNSVFNYIQQIESKKLIPIISKNDINICNIDINSIMVITPEMKELEEQKYFLQNKINTNMFLKYKDIDILDFLLFVKIIQELSLYGIFINILEETDFEQLKTNIQNLSLPLYKKDKIIQNIHIIQNNYLKYDKLYNEYIDIIFDTSAKLEQINDMEEFLKLKEELELKYKGELI